MVGIKLHIEPFRIFQLLKSDLRLAQAPLIRGGWPVPMRLAKWVINERCLERCSNEVMVRLDTCRLFLIRICVESVLHLLTRLLLVIALVLLIIQLEVPQRTLVREWYINLVSVPTVAILAFPTKQLLNFRSLLFGRRRKSKIVSFVHYRASYVVIRVVSLQMMAVCALKGSLKRTRDTVIESLSRVRFLPLTHIIFNDMSQWYCFIMPLYPER